MWSVSYNYHVTKVALCSRPIVIITCSFDIVGWATGKGIRPVKSGCWFVSGDDLTGALHVLYAKLYIYIYTSCIYKLSPPLPSSLAPVNSGMETF